MGRAAIHCLQILAAVILLQALLFISTTSCIAELEHPPLPLSASPSLSRHIVPRDPTTSLADPVAATASPANQDDGDDDEDALDDSDEEATPTTTTTASPPSTSSPPPLETNVTGTNYTVRLNCDESYGEFCEKVRGAAVDAVRELINVVKFDNDNITVQLNYTSFCEKECANDTLGWGAPASQFIMLPGDPIDTDYLYPQILAKQFEQRTSEWADHDVYVEINHDAYMSAVDYDAAEEAGWNGTGVPPRGKYWFKDEGPILDYQIDMTYIVLHEILHGVGIISSWGAYFIENSPLHQLIRQLIGDLFEEEELRLVTPSPSSTVLYGAGPVFITGFQRNMLFDKYLNVDYTNLNETNRVSLKDFGLDMLNFCVQDNDAFIVNFVRKFLTEENISRQSAQLYGAFAIAGTVTFDFPLSSSNKSIFNTNSYLNETYRRMTLLTGDSINNGPPEHFSASNNRPDMMISHLSGEYASTPDFIMTDSFRTGATLPQLIDSVYNDTPIVSYTEELANGTIVTHVYRSPIGPGILRMLGSMGYSTVLKRTNYNTTLDDSKSSENDSKDEKSCRLNRSYSRRRNSNSSAAVLLAPSRGIFMLPVILSLLLPLLYY
ncbi:hypothetical protein BDB00DRAFT_831379 [Zychaea mexicana]|uniref:uncharacterized protein n=1 Tax=Zychaea mexicana TaxID=64656 RepID=UPI0022FE8E17|nr:uncharacterized protein BDB00DRAFT_831379 [Zychaea mexicana]KAI9491767.1 hypothetical protein BDB00DRAFT_831379 [Zychaea mexicana]